MKSLQNNNRRKGLSRREKRSKFNRIDKSEKKLVGGKKSKVKYEMVDKPEEGKCFKVYPKAIRRSLFNVKRKDLMQEATRKLICKALDEVEKHPRKYGIPFATFIPEKDWEHKTVDEFIKVAEHMGDHIADWVEQALEWAQRIDNGESWEVICNTPDTAKWYRIILWKNGFARLVGGSHISMDNLPPSAVFGNYCHKNEIFFYTVPLVILYI